MGDVETHAAGVGGHRRVVPERCCRSSPRARRRLRSRNRSRCPRCGCCGHVRARWRRRLVETSVLPFTRLPWVWAVSQMPRLFPMIVLLRTMLSRTPESADGNGSGGSTGRDGSCSSRWPEADRGLLRHLGRDVLDDVARGCRGLSAMPQSKSRTRPFLIVTLAWPALRTPAPRPLPSIVWPSRSIVIPGAPTTKAVPEAVDQVVADQHAVRGPSCRRRRRWAPGPR